MVNPEKEQWDRLERWYVRLCAQARRGVSLPASQALVDFSLVVLEQCDAMRDWLLQSAVIKTERNERDPDRRTRSLELQIIPKADVEQLFATPELMLARDIANGAKHLRLDRRVQLDRDIVSDVPFPLSVTGEPRPLRVVFVPPSTQIEYDALDLCRACVLRIRGFLVAHGWSVSLLRLVNDVSDMFEPVDDPKGTPWP